MFSIYNRLKSIFYPTNPNKRKSDELSDTNELKDSLNDSFVHSSKLPLTERQVNFNISTSHTDSSQTDKNVHFVYNDTILNKNPNKKFRLDPIYSKHEILQLTHKNNNENVDNKISQCLKTSFDVTKYTDNLPVLSSLSVKSKSHLFDSKLITNLTKPSIYADSRQKRLQSLQAESQVNKENIKKCESNYIEDITECFRELCSIPPVVFPKTSKKLQFPKITNEMMETVRQSYCIKNRDYVLVEEFNLSVTVKDLISLAPGQWLTDNIINFYFELICARNNGSPNLPSVQILSTFFYSKLKEAGYSAIKRWTKRRPIFGSQLVLVPIHLGNHWCFVLIDFINQEVSYYDSLKSQNPQCLSLMRTFLIEDYKDKLKKNIDINEWSFKQIYDGPSQHNGYDCGVFLSQTAEFLSRKAKLEFKQDHMPYFREKMSYEILHKKLL